MCAVNNIGQQTTPRLEDTATEGQMGIMNGPEPSRMRRGVSGRRVAAAQLIRSFGVGICGALQMLVEALHTANRC